MRDEPFEDVQHRTPENDQEAYEAQEEFESAEARSQGREVQDRTREGMPHGVDVITDAENPEIESQGETVIDRTRHAETHGVDVIDLGPAGDEYDEQPER